MRRRRQTVKYGIEPAAATDSRPYPLDLDHSLVNEALLLHVTGATVWHINAGEVDLIDYDMTFKQDALYAPDAYRSSDHDPTIVGLAVCDADTVGPALGVSVSQVNLWPPDNRMVTVQATIDVTDNFDDDPGSRWSA